MQNTCFETFLLLILQVKKQQRFKKILMLNALQTESVLARVSAESSLKKFK